MGRTRMIKPSFFKHADLYAAERECGLPLRVAFAGLWTVADREGRFKWKHDLKPDVLPYDPVDMLAVLDALESAGFVQRYVVEGKQYGRIPSFGDHQTFHKTERHSTIPAPVVNGGSPVRHTADTVTVAVTQLDVVEEGDERAADEAQSPVAEPALTALYLAIWANKAVAEKWGERPSPYTPAQCEAIAVSLCTTGVEWQTARGSIYRQCRESKAAVPPRSPAYFRPGIESEWESELARRAVAASGEVPPAPPSEASAALNTGARREHWTDRKAREDREDSDRQAIRIRSGNVEQRRLADDGPAWWARIQREAKAAKVNAFVYGFDHIHEPAEPSNEAAHV